VFAVSPVMAVWFGRVTGGLLLVSGASQVLPIPPSPLITEELHAMLLCIASLVPITIGEYVAFNLAILKAIPIDPRSIDVARKLQRQTFEVFRDGADSITKLMHATYGPSQPRNEGRPALQQR
jgi:hypothetical protein